MITIKRLSHVVPSTCPIKRSKSRIPFLASCWTLGAPLCQNIILLSLFTFLQWPLVVYDVTAPRWNRVDDNLSWTSWNQFSKDVVRDERTRFLAQLSTAMRPNSIWLPLIRTLAALGKISDFHEAMHRDFANQKLRIFNGKVYVLTEGMEIKLQYLFRPLENNALCAYFYKNTQSPFVNS